MISRGRLGVPLKLRMQATVVPRIGWLVRLAALGAASLAACGSPPAPVAESPASPPPVPPSVSILPAPKDHPSPPPLRWEVTLAEIALARYRADAPVPSPAVTPTGTLVVGMSRTLFGVGLDGTVRWRVEAMSARGPLYPLVPSDTTIAVLNDTGILTVVDSQGRQITAVGGASTGGGNPGLGHDGSFYIPGSRALWAFSPPPALRDAWRYSGSRWYGVAVGADDTVYAATDGGTLHAVRKDGTPRWSLPLDRGPRSAPAIDGEGTLYVGDASGHVRAVSAEGRVLWTYDAGGPVVPPPVIGSDGTIYVGSDDKKLHALTSAGASRWTFETDGPIRSAAAVAQDGTVYVGSNDGRLYALRSDGSEKWSMAVPGAVFSPTILLDGTVVFASGDGVVRAVPDRGNGGLASAPWPKWACDLANTSRAPRPPARSY